MAVTTPQTFENLPEGYTFLPSNRGVIYNDSYRYHGYVNGDLTISFQGETYPDIESFTTAVAQRVIKSDEYNELLRSGRALIEAGNLQTKLELTNKEILEKKEVRLVEKDDTKLYLSIFLIVTLILAISSTTALTYYRNI